MIKLLRPAKGWIAALVIAAAVLLTLLFYRPLCDILRNAGILKAGPHGTFVEVLDVGEGDAILLCDSGRVCLVDTGDLPDTGAAMVNKLNSRGITTIDSLVLTHPHADHAGGLFLILEKFKVKNLYFTYFERENANLAEYFNRVELSAKKKGVKITALKAGLQFDTGRIKISVLFANGPTDNIETAENDRSAVLFAEVYDAKFLLMADAGFSTERYLTDAYGKWLKCDVLKVAHHGSDAATSDLFLDCARPEYAAVSCGAGNNYGHPAKDTLRRLGRHKIQTLRTDIHGDIKFFVEKNGKIYVE